LRRDRRAVRLVEVGIVVLLRLYGVLILGIILLVPPFFVRLIMTERVLQPLNGILEETTNPLDQHSPIS
jgi:hypothetical protein